MSRPPIWHSSRLLRLQLALILGLTSLIGLLLVMGLTRSPDVALADDPAIRYVAPAGDDSSNDCTSSSAPCATIQHAVGVADAGDEIRAASGTYTGTEDNVVTITKSITIIGGFESPDWSTPVSSTTTQIDGEGVRRGLQIQGPITVALANLMVTRGRAGTGGGLWQIGISGRLNISHARFENNVSPSTYANDGGGALQTWGQVTLYRTEVISNHAQKMCGGLYLRGKATLIETSVLSNSTHNMGGGLCSTGALTVSDSVFKRNVALQTYPSTSYGGGAIRIVGGAIILNRTQVVNNAAARHGGGLYLEGGVLTMTNSIVADNQSAISGSGLYITGSSSYLLHTTVARNNGGDGSGVYITGTNSHVALTNTILVSHTVGITVAAGNTATLEATLWGANTWANGTDWSGEGAIVTGTRNYWGAPAFVDPNAEDYHIKASSAAVDKGVDAGVDVDIDGEPRPSFAGYDLGADERWRWMYLPVVLRDWAPTPTPIVPVYCTPPPCKFDEGEVYHCPSECPGGCGTICATVTPAP